MSKKKVTPEGDRTAQDQFIERLKASIPVNHSLVDELADLLQISSDSAYRRIRGETALSIDEVTRLCSHYRIPFDYMGQPEGPGNSVTFHYHHLSDKSDHFTGYLSNLLNDMKRIKSCEPKQIVYAAEDVPIFHHFCHKLLSAFKLFYWSKSILNVPEFADKKFDPSFVPAEQTDIVSEIYKVYLDIPSVEVWSEDTLNSTVKQVEYYWESGLFAGKEQALELLNEVEKSVKHLALQATHSSKFAGEVPPSDSKQNFMLYTSELLIGNNCILITAGANKSAYLSHNTFNAMVTTNPSFCEETEHWMDNLIKKSILISGVSEKQRLRFFNKMQKKIDELRERINKE